MFSITGSSSRYKYTGKELDDSTGLYFYEARYYDPVIGKFISADTIIPNPMDPEAFNRYGYARNNPLIYTDPTGHFFGSIFKGIGNFFKGLGQTIAGALQGDLNSWIQIAIIAGAAYAGGYVANAVKTSALGAGGTLASNAAIIGGIAGGAAAGFTASVGFKAAGYNVDIGQSIGLGALGGGLGAGITGSSLPVPAKYAAGFLVAGGMAELAGGDFAEGIGYAMGAMALYHAVKIVVENIESLRKNRWEKVDEVAGLWDIVDSWDKANESKEIRDGAQEKYYEELDKFFKGKRTNSKVLEDALIKKEILEQKHLNNVIDFGKEVTKEGYPILGKELLEGLKTKGN